MSESSTYGTNSIREILLVVIGILIAIHINTLNENRIISYKETLILKVLYQEFQKNNVKLDSTI